MAAHDGGDALEGHHRVECGHLDADDAGEIEDRVQRVASSYATPPAAS